MPRFSRTRTAQEPGDPAEPRRWRVTEETTLEVNVWPIWNLLYDPASSRLVDPSVIPLGRLPGSGPGVGEIQMFLEQTPLRSLTGVVIEEFHPPTHVVYSGLKPPPLPRLTTEITLTPHSEQLTKIRYSVTGQFFPRMHVDVELWHTDMRKFIRDYFRKLQHHLTAPPRP